MIRSKPSEFVSRHLPTAQGEQWALDLACGGGRHTFLLLDRGYKVVALDKDVSALHPAQNLELVTQDLEINGGVWPFRKESFGVVVVVNYLWRPIFSDILTAVAPGGLLFYETFREGQEAVGRPRNPDFLLRPNELKDRVKAGFSVLDFFDGLDQTSGNYRQRICAKRSG